jgi:hypothetical protein
MSGVRVGTKEFKSTVLACGLFMTAGWVDVAIPPDHSPSAVSAAELTLRILKSDVASNAPVKGFIVLPSRTVMSAEEAVLQLVGVPKPTSCRGALVDSIVEIDCTPVLNKALVQRRRSWAEDIGRSYDRTLSLQCEHDSGGHQVQVVVGGSSFVVKLLAIQEWMQDYDMPYILPLWTRRSQSLPDGVCGMIIVRPTPEMQIRIQRDRERGSGTEHSG